MYTFDLSNMFMLIPTQQYLSVSTETRTFSSQSVAHCFALKTLQQESHVKKSSQVRALLGSTTSCLKSSSTD